MPTCSGAGWVEISVKRGAVVEHRCQSKQDHRMPWDTLTKSNIAAAWQGTFIITGRETANAESQGILSCT